MKNTFYKIICFTLLLVGCVSQENQLIGESIFPIQSVEPGVLLSDLNGGGNIVEMEGKLDGEWNVEVPSAFQSWVSISRPGEDPEFSLSLQNTSKFVVYVKPNIDRFMREASILVTQGGELQNLRVNQRSMYAGSASFVELVSMSMGEVILESIALSELTSIEQLGVKGLGIKDLAVEKLVSGNVKVESLPEYRSVSTPGIYTATGKAYINLEVGGLLSLQNIQISDDKDVVVNFGITQYSLIQNPADTFNTKRFDVLYATKTDPKQTVADSEYKLAVLQHSTGKPEWSLMSITIPASEIKDGDTYLDLRFKSRLPIVDKPVDPDIGPTQTEGDGETGGESKDFITLLDDIAVFQNAAPLQILNKLEVNEITDYSISLSAQALLMPEDINLKAEEVLKAQFLLAPKDVETIEWDTTTVDYNDYATTISGLTSMTDYFVKSLILTDDSLLIESVQKSITTLVAPNVELTSPSKGTNYIELAARVLQGGKELSSDRILARGFRYRLASEETYTDLPIALDQPFNTTIDGLLEGEEYVAEGYVKLQSGELEQDFATQDIFFTNITPIEIYTASVLTSGKIQAGQESTFEFVVPYNGTIAPGAITYTVQGPLAEVFTVERVEGDENVATQEGFTNTARFRVSGLLAPSLEGEATVYDIPIQFLRKDDRDNPVTHKVAVYDVNGLTAMAIADFYDWLKYDVTIGTKGTTYKEYFFNKPNDMYGGAFSSTMSRVSLTDPNNEGFKTMGSAVVGGVACIQMQISKNYVVADVDNPTEYVLFEVPVPVGLDLEGMSIFSELSIKSFAGETFQWRMALSTDNGATWTLPSENGVFTPTKVAYELFSPKFSNISPIQSNKILLRMSADKPNTNSVGKNANTIRSYKFLFGPSDYVPEVE